jgi:hypothetical protein
MTALGRFAEAKKSLNIVTRMSKEDLLFNAHYRVGLPPHRARGENCEVSRR